MVTEVRLPVTGGCCLCFGKSLASCCLPYCVCDLNSFQTRGCRGSRAAFQRSNVVIGEVCAAKMETGFVQMVLSTWAQNRPFPTAASCSFLFKALPVAPLFWQKKILRLGNEKKKKTGTALFFYLAAREGPVCCPATGVYHAAQGRPRAAAVALRSAPLAGGDGSGSHSGGPWGREGEGEVAAGSVRRDWGSTGGTGRFLPGRCSGDAERGSGASPLRASARLSALPVPPLSLVRPDAGLRLFLFRPPELVDGPHASLNLSGLSLGRAAYVCGGDWPAAAQPRPVAASTAFPISTFFDWPGGLSGSSRIGWCGQQGRLRERRAGAEAASWEV